VCSLLLGGLLRLLIVLPEVTFDGGFKFGILHGVLGLELILKGIATSNYDGRVGLDNNSGLELSDELALDVREDRVGLEELVLNALLDTNLGADGVLEA